MRRGRFLRPSVSHSSRPPWLPFQAALGGPCASSSAPCASWATLDVFATLMSPFWRVKQASDAAVIEERPPCAQRTCADKARRRPRRRHVRVASAVPPPSTHSPPTQIIRTAEHREPVMTFHNVAEFTNAYLPAPASARNATFRLAPAPACAGVYDPPSIDFRMTSGVLAGYVAGSASRQGHRAPPFTPHSPLPAESSMSRRPLLRAPKRSSAPVSIA